MFFIHFLFQEFQEEKKMFQGWQLKFSEYYCRDRIENLDKILIMFYAR